VADKHPPVVKELDAAYDKWWDAVRTRDGERERRSGRRRSNPFKECFATRSSSAASCRGTNGRTSATLNTEAGIMNRTKTAGNERPRSLIPTLHW